MNDLEKILSTVKDMITTLNNLLENYEKETPTLPVPRYEIRYWDNSISNIDCRPCEPDTSATTLDFGRDRVIHFAKSWYNVELYDVKNKKVVIYYKEER